MWCDSFNQSVIDYDMTITSADGVMQPAAAVTQFACLTGRHWLKQVFNSLVHRFTRITTIHKSNAVLLLSWAWELQLRHYCYC